MDLIHVFVKFECQFSGCIDTKIKTVSIATYNKMVAGIGDTFSHFDKAAAIRYDWKVIEVRQATPDDYKK